MNMMGITHAAAGALLGAAVAHFTGNNLALCMGVGAVAGLLPDIDSPGSTIGRRVYPVSSMVNLAAGHRGVIHTVWFCLAASLGLAALTPVVGAYAGRYIHLHAWPAAWLVGVLVLLATLAHLALDACTLSGIRPLAPLNVHLRGPVRTGGALEIPVLFAFLLGFFWVGRVF
jgi:inner membrane protein